MFDTVSCRYYKIDELTFEALTHCLKNNSTAKVDMLAEAKFDSHAIECVFEEIQFLTENGLFDQPDYHWSDDGIKSSIPKNTPLYAIELLLAENCNLACSYCYGGGFHNESVGLMSQETARTAVDRLFEWSRDLNRVDITLFGGEPLLNKKILKFIIEYSQSLGRKYNKEVTYRMTTNATLLCDEIVSLIKEYRIGTMVSLDGPQELHDKQCPTRTGKGSFEQVMEGLKKLAEAHVPFDIRCTMTHPAPDLKSLITYFSKFPVRKIVIGPSQNLTGSSNCVDFTEEDYQSYVEQSEQLLPWLIDELSAGRNRYDFPQTKTINRILRGEITSAPPWFRKCGACFDGMCCGIDGSLYPCSKFAGMKNWRIGNIQTGVDEEKRRLFLFRYAKAISEHCHSCWAFSVCRGPCPWEIALENGDFDSRVRFCSHYKRIIYELAGYICSSEKLSGLFRRALEASEDEKNKSTGSSNKQSILSNSNPSYQQEIN